MDNTRELGIQLHDLAKGMRLLKQRYADTRSAVPLGTVGLLLQIDEFAAGCHARHLAVRAGLDPSTVSRAVAALVAHGLVERQSDPADGRASVLALTTAGRAALSDTWDWYGRMLDRALADWSPTEVTALRTVLGRFNRDIGNTLGNHDILEAAR